MFLQLFKTLKFHLTKLPVFLLWAIETLGPLGEELLTQEGMSLLLLQEAIVSPDQATMLTKLNPYKETYQIKHHPFLHQGVNKPILLHLVITLIEYHMTKILLFQLLNNRTRPITKLLQFPQLVRLRNKLILMSHLQVKGREDQDLQLEVRPIITILH